MLNWQFVINIHEIWVYVVQFWWKGGGGGEFSIEVHITYRKREVRGEGEGGYISLPKGSWWHAHARPTWLLHSCKGEYICCTQVQNCNALIFTLKHSLCKPQFLSDGITVRYLTDFAQNQSEFISPP